VPIDALLYRKVMSNFATGVTVMTTVAPDGVFGMTANSLTSVSLDPTMLLVCVGRDSLMHDYVGESRVFALSILSSAHQDISALFAREDHTPERRLTTVRYRPAGTGSPILEDAIAYLDCRVVADYPGGDHTIFVAEVEQAAVLNGQADPLIYFHSQYRQLAS
jgi:flavin reductase (DIM6/NTAB) family NADH-FMN oxidoreductase RutF